jgi:lariat debranching enzyme
VGTLGSPPLLEILRHIQPEHWFAAHLHVKFAAVFDHGTAGMAIQDVTIGGIEAEEDDDLGKLLAAELAKDNPDEIHMEDEDDDDVDKEEEGLFNPDEIVIEEEDDFEEILPEKTLPSTGITPHNPEEIRIEDEEFDDPPSAAPQISVMSVHKSSNNAEAGPSTAREAVIIDESVDVVEAIRTTNGQTAAKGVIGVSKEDAIATISNGVSGATGSGRRTKFLALDKCGPGKDFIQVWLASSLLHIRLILLQFLDIPTPHPHEPGQRPKLTYDPQWLAITRAFHPYLSLNHSQIPLPPPESLTQLVQDEVDRLKGEGLLVPEQTTEADGMVRLVWDKGDVEIERVQKFWPTAPAEGQPGGSACELTINVTDGES